MLDQHADCVVVVDDDRAVGVLTDTDFRPREEGVPFSFGVRFPTVVGELADSEANIVVAFRRYRDTPVFRPDERSGDIGRT